MRRRSAEIRSRCRPAVALYILNHKRETLVADRARATASASPSAATTRWSRRPSGWRQLRALTPAEIAALPVPVVPVAEPEEDEDEPIEDIEDIEDTAPVEAHAPAPESDAEPIAAQDGEQPRPEPRRGRRRPRRRRRRRRRGRREDGRDGGRPREARPPHGRQQEGRPQEAWSQSGGQHGGRWHEGMPMMPPPLQDVTAPLGDLAEDDGFEPEGEPERRAARRRRRRRRTTRRAQAPPPRPARRPKAPAPRRAGPGTAICRRRRSADGSPTCRSPSRSSIVPPRPPHDERGARCRAAFRAAPAPRAEESGAESVPVADRATSRARARAAARAGAGRRSAAAAARRRGRSADAHRRGTAPQSQARLVAAGDRSLGEFAQRIRRGGSRGGGVQAATAGARHRRRFASRYRRQAWSRRAASAMVSVEPAKEMRRLAWPRADRNRCPACRRRRSRAACGGRIPGCHW